MKLREQMFPDAAAYPQLFLSFMQNSPALWWMKDAAGTYLFVNKTFAKFYHISADRVVGRNDFDLMPAHTAEQLRENDRVVLESQTPIHIHEAVVTPDGPRIILAAKFPFAENGRKFVGGIGFDVTDSRQAQVELESARDRALEAEALKSAFVSSIQHEIRTPLAGIIGMNQFLLETDLNAEQLEFAQLVQGSSQALLTVMNDILDLSKFESGRLHLAQVPVNINLLVDESIRLIAAAARHKGLLLHVEPDSRIPARVFCDPERLRQVLLNLLSNAVKFTAQGRVDVRVKLLQQSDDTVLVRFSIQDTGIGIEPEKQPYLFMPFWQADMSNTRVHGGPGLGLPVSKHIVEKMGSEGIQVESTPQQGSLFWFDVPLATRITTGDIKLPDAEMMIVEDNPTLQSSMMRQFENLGIAVDAVDNCSDAELLVGEKPYRLVLCERVVQNADALDLVQRIRAKENQTGRLRTAIVVMAAEPKLEDRAFYISKGADDYVAKPLSIEQLWRIVNYWAMV